MKASLVLCTKNGGKRLEKCLSEIDRLSGPPDLEIILVDNGSTDGISPDILRSFQAKSIFKTLVTQVSTPGNAAGRNKALELATGDIVLFIDDDCYPDREFAHDWISIFSSAEIGYGSGRILKYDPNQSGIGCVDKGTEWILPKRAFLPRGLVQGSNMAFRRQCLVQAGLFDERFGAGTKFAGEEWELAARISHLGWSGGYFPRPTVEHDHGRFGAEARKRMLYYDYGAGAVYAKLFLTTQWLKIGRVLVGELRALRRDPIRFIMILNGFLSFIFVGFRKPSR